jgi:hypothetical protein
MRPRHLCEVWMTRAIDRFFSRAGVALVIVVSFAPACSRETQQAAELGSSGFLSIPTAAGSALTEVGEQQPASVESLQSEVLALREQAVLYEQRLASMRGQLSDSEARRIEREHEWMEYSQLLGRIAPERLPGGKVFEAQLPQAEAAEQPAAPSPPDPMLEARARELERALRTLLRLEQVRGIDLLECGSFDGENLGPVVFRLLDGSGRLSGGLYANRLRLEASRSAHTLTLVLEDGYETRGGERIPFGGAAPESKLAAARRILIDGVDPLAWADDLRELFGENGLDVSGDDGLWDLVLLRSRLNQLLETQSAGGVYRLRALGGVQDGVLFGVHLERLDEQGHVERRLFADRLRITRSAGGVELILESGVQVRGDQQRVPFLDGRYRILLPSADGERWSSAAIPGLSPAPAH